MLNKRIKFLLIVLVISVVYSWLSIFVFEDSSEYDISYTSSAPKQTQNNQQNAQPDRIDDSSFIEPVRSKKNINKYATSAVSLPKTFLLRGAIAKTDDVLAAALIEHKGDLSEYELGNYILNTDMQITDINKSSIVVSYKNEEFRIDLTPPNLLAPDYRSPSESMAQLLNMTPKEIGSRPRIIEHMLILTPTPYIADGQLVHPGLNPSLFKQAGFQEDDVLKTINGKSVTIEHELEEIKKELLDAHTLTFQVMRKGRLITLYLDIPSEALDVSYD